MLSKILRSYLRFWAKIYLNRSKPQIIAVTGSVGKTSTKEAIFEVLKVKFGSDIRKSTGNQNTETGVPLAILGYEQGPSYAHGSWHWLPIIFSAPFKSFFMKKSKVLVLEMAADKPGDIEYLTKIVKPHVSVITNIGLSHMEQFGTQENIFEEKTGILKYLQSDNWAVLNADDLRLRNIGSGQKYKTLAFSIKNQADMTAVDIATKISNFRGQTTFKIETKDDQISVRLNSLGKEANVYAALAGAACGKIFGLTFADIAKGLSEIASAKHRQEVVKGKNDAIVIDDAYNASPASMRAALETLNALSAKRKIAVLGEMRELGEKSQASHELIGEIARTVADEVVTFGEKSRDYRGKHFEDKEKLIDYLLSTIKEGDIILVKASRGGAKEPELSAVVEALRA